MASHKGWDRHYPVISVASGGAGSFNLSKGQLALIDLDAAPSANGLKVIDDLAGASPDKRLQLRLGKYELQNNRSQSSKDWSSETFKITDVVKLAVDAPDADNIKTDKFILGYDGLDPNTAIVLNNGENEEISLTLCGELMGAIGYNESEVEVKVYLGAPNTGSFTMQEIVETAVAQFNEYKLMGDIPITNYIDVKTVDSTKVAATGTDQAFYSLVVKDRGNSNALAAVQGQYPDYKVERTDRQGQNSTYTLIDAPGASIPDFVETPDWIVKGCAACPAGYDTFVDGYVYSISIEDNGSDESAALEALFANAEAGSTTKVSQVDGVGTYTIVVTAEIEQAEIDALILAYPEAELTLVSKNAAEICAPTSTVTTSWVEGDTCKVEEETYFLVLADDDCGNNRLAELQAAYPELTIAVDTAGACQTKYSTTVTTNIVCDECDPIFNELFSSEAPSDYGQSSWAKDPKVYDPAALMGIIFEAKPVILSGEEEYRDDMPFFATSVRLKVAGGAYTNVNESFFSGTSGRIAGRLLRIGAEPVNWGGNLREFEDIQKRYEEGVSRHEGNNYGKWILGEESLLDPTIAYVDYILTVKVAKYAQSFSGGIEETFNYHFLVAPGVHTDVEALLNTIAAKAGVPTVQAFAVDA